mgnify:CR=1 FL=1
MLEQKLIVNRYIDLTLANNAAPPYADGDFVTVPVQQCYLRESTGIFSKRSSVQQGRGPKAHRNFKWLPWLPGAISEVALAHRGGRGSKADGRQGLRLGELHHLDLRGERLPKLAHRQTVGQLHRVGPSATRRPPPARSRFRGLSSRPTSCSA